MKRILIVDDQAHVIRIIKLVLERAGYAVESAPNGEKGLAIICNDPPDVVITDIDMPRMTGEQMCKIIHNEFAQRDFPIFVITSRTERAHRDWSSQIPNLTFLEKPVSARELVATINAYFESKSAEA